MLVTAGKQWLPKTSVTILPVIVKEASTVSSGSPLFQTAGWVEPRPQAISVAAMAAGVIDELLVVEGQFVERDAPLARLVMEDTELLVRQARANLALREGERERCDAELKAATSRLEHPVHLEVLLAEASGTLAKARSEMGRLPNLIEAARSTEAFAKSNWEGKKTAQEGLVGRVVKQAENEYVTAKTTLKELVERGPFLEKEIEASQRKVSAIEFQIKQLVDENRQFDEAKAKVRSAKAAVDEAIVQVEQAELNLKRMTIQSPIRGRILRLLVSRGTRVMGLETTAGQNTSTIALMYDPTQLQIRADVRLEDVPKIQIGQNVEVRTASATEVIRGQVLQATSSANIQKNTLEVKVALIDPPPSVCPEMLVTATFISPVLPTSVDQSASSKRLFIPRVLIQTQDARSLVWIVDERKFATLRNITINPSSAKDELCEVTSGLVATDKLIVQGREGVREGARLSVVGEDQVLGVRQ
jgi:multidrug resistance efflux pump